MFTPWKNPSTARQYAEHESHIPWDASNQYHELFYPGKQRFRSSSELFRIANPTAHDITTMTWFLETGGYNFDIGSRMVAGVEVSIQAKRFSRVMDETVILSANGTLYGENMATSSVDPQKLYGNGEDLWGVNEGDMFFAQPSFGLTLRFQSHYSTPHRDPIYIESIAIRLNLV